MLMTICCAYGVEAWRWIMGAQVRDDGWRLPDELWARMEPLLPPRPRHPLGCHNPRVPDRAAMDAIFFVLRTGCQWNALKVTGICSSSSAHRRFLEWTGAGVFHEFWRRGLLAYDELVGIEWDWLALDGAMGKAPLGGGGNRPQPDRPGQGRHEAQPADGRSRGPARPRGRWRQPERPQADARDSRGDPGRAAGADA
jgi:transposase